MIDWKILFALFLALVWGVIWAVTLQVTRTGKVLVARLTWLAVVIGVGVDLLIITIVVQLDVVFLAACIIGVSAIPIITRSIRNELIDYHKLLQKARTNGQPQNKNT